MAFGNTAYWWLLRQEIKAGRRNRPLETGVFVFEPIPWKNGYHNLNYSDPSVCMCYALQIIANVVIQLNPKHHAPVNS